MSSYKPGLACRRWLHDSVLALRAVFPETQRTSCACPGLRNACWAWAADSEPRHIFFFFFLWDMGGYAAK